MKLYTDIDEHSIAWLNELMEMGELPPAIALQEDINDLTPTYLKLFTQVHFFAGIGGWPLACKWAKVPQEIRLFTGSPPCQPFSQSGKGAGIDDHRHLWPALHWHIEHCKPDLVVGEQVLSPAALEWWDKVALDLEGSGYSPWAIALPASSVGAYQRRYRIYWCGVSPSMARTNFSSDVQGKIGGGIRWTEETQVFGQWQDIQWKTWGDGHVRPIERQLSPVVNGDTPGMGSCWHQCTKAARLQRMRGYGNAIVPQVGAVFLKIILGIDI